MSYMRWLQEVAVAAAVEDGVPREKARKDFVEAMDGIYEDGYRQGHSDGEVGLML